MKIVDPHYRTMRQLKNDPKLPLTAMSTFAHFAKATLSSPTISLMIPLATENSNHLWHGPYIIQHCLTKGAYILASPEGLTLKEPVNGLYLKKFYA
jgi:hypothetical protein